jgi:hypothetical protein
VHACTYTHIHTYIPCNSARWRGNISARRDRINIFASTWGEEEEDEEEDDDDDDDEDDDVEDAEEAEDEFF